MMDIDLEVILKDILIRYKATISDGNYRLSYSDLEEEFIIRERAISHTIKWVRVFDTPAIRIALSKYIKLIEEYRG